MALDTWTFSTELEGAALGADLLGAREVVLQLGGVDTFASITLNGQPILSTNNFHRCVAVAVDAFGSGVSGWAGRQGGPLPGWPRLSPPEADTHVLPPPRVRVCCLHVRRSWAVPVKRLLRPDGPNALAITIRPAAQESVSLKARHPYTVPALAQMGSIGSYIFARKPASDFGWCADAPRWLCRN